MLVGNKKDMEHKRVISREEGEAYAKKHGLLFCETSAKTGEGVDDAFFITANRVLELINSGTFNLNDDVSFL